MNSTLPTRSLLMAYIALGAVCIIWGTTYLGLRVGVTRFPPFLFSLLRFIISGPLLVGFMLTFGKAKWPDWKTVFHQAVSGVLMVTLGISVVGWSEVYISSGVAAVICSMMPIWTVVINIMISRDERPNGLIVFGLLTGMAGILLIFGEHLSEFSNSNYITGIVLTFAANLCWAIGSIYIKRKNQHSDPFLNAGLQMLFGGIFLIPTSLLLDDYTDLTWSAPVVYSLIYMALVGSVAAYACYSYAIKHLPMTIVSLYAYVNPIVAVILGWLVLDEKLNGQILLSIVVVVLGVYLVNRGYQLKMSASSPLSRLKGMFNKTISR